MELSENIDVTFELIKNIKGVNEIFGFMYSSKSKCDSLEFRLLEIWKNKKILVFA